MLLNVEKRVQNFNHTSFYINTLDSQSCGKGKGGPTITYLIEFLILDSEGHFFMHGFIKYKEWSA